MTGPRGAPPTACPPPETHLPPCWSRWEPEIRVSGAERGHEVSPRGRERTWRQESPPSFVYSTISAQGSRPCTTEICSPAWSPQPCSCTFCSAGLHPPAGSSLRHSLRPIPCLQTKRVLVAVSPTELVGRPDDQRHPAGAQREVRLRGAERRGQRLVGRRPRGER